MMGQDPAKTSAGSSRGLELFSISRSFCVLGNRRNVPQNRASRHPNAFSTSSVSCFVDIFRVLDDCEVLGQA